MKPNQLLIFILFCCSCQSNSDRSDLLTKKAKPISWEQFEAEAQKDREIYGVVEISKDSIVLLRRSLGIELSTDGGKTWTWMAKRIHRLNELTIDQNGRWWGLEYWIGIHEADYCSLHVSSDKGKSWKSYKLDPRKFFPTHIYSNLHDAVQMVDFNSKKVYRLTGDDSLKQWSFVKQLPNHDNDILNLSAENYFLHYDTTEMVDKLSVKRKNRLVDTLMGFPKASNIIQMEKHGNEIYIAGSEANGSNSYFAIVKNERLFKEFVIPGGDMSFTLTKLGRVYIDGTEGVFQYKKDTLLHIYK